METEKILLSIAGSLIILLLSIIAFFLVRYVRGQDSKVNKITNSLNALANNIKELNTIIVLQRKKLDNLSRQFKKHTQEHV